MTASEPKRRSAWLAGLYLSCSQGSDSSTAGDSRRRGDGNCNGMMTSPTPSSIAPR